MPITLCTATFHRNPHQQSAECSNENIRAGYTVAMEKFIVATSYFRFRGMSYQRTFSNGDGESSVTRNRKSVFLMTGAANHGHSSSNMRAKTMEEICG